MKLSDINQDDVFQIGGKGDLYKLSPKKSRLLDYLVAVNIKSGEEKLILKYEGVAVVKDAEDEVEEKQEDQLPPKENKDENYFTEVFKDADTKEEDPVVKTEETEDTEDTKEEE